MSVEKPVFAIITCSDTRGPECDTAGDALESLIEEQGWACRTHMIVKDDRAGIAAAIKRCTDDLKVDIVLTCGGSGLSPRDNTPRRRATCASARFPASPRLCATTACRSLPTRCSRAQSACSAATPSLSTYREARRPPARIGTASSLRFPCGKDDGRRRALIPLPLYCRFVSKRARTA